LTHIFNSLLTALKCKAETFEMALASVEAKWLASEARSSNYSRLANYMKFRQTKLAVKMLPEFTGFEYEYG